MKIYFYSIFLFCVVSCSSYKPFKPLEKKNLQNELQVQLQTILDQAVNEFKLPGVQAGILFANKEMILASSGTVDFQRKKGNIHNENVFRIGSTTKMFVAALIAKLVEKDLLSYDSTIEKWFPKLPFAKEVTVKQLLNHTSGIQENLFTGISILVKSMLSDEKKWDAYEVVYDLMGDMQVKPQPERTFVYSNNNYLLLGLIAEQVTGKKINTLLETEIFKPLTMKHTYLLPYYSKLPTNLISGYDEFIPMGPHEITASNTSWDTLTFTAGAMASNATDLLLWLDALFHGKVLNVETLAKMRSYVNSQENGRDNNMVKYGLGIAKYELNGNFLEGHPGAGFGGECFPFYFAEKDISLVVIYNWSKKDNPAGKALLQRIIDQMIK